MKKKSMKRVAELIAKTSGMELRPKNTMPEFERYPPRRAPKNAPKEFKIVVYATYKGIFSTLTESKTKVAVDKLKPAQTIPENISTAKR